MWETLWKNGIKLTDIVKIDHHLENDIEIVGFRTWAIYQQINWNAVENFFLKLKVRRMGYLETKASEKNLECMRIFRKLGTCYMDFHVNMNYHRHIPECTFHTKKFGGMSLPKSNMRTTYPYLPMTTC